MGNTKWTNEQLEAIVDNSGNLLVRPLERGNSRSGGKDHPEDNQSQEPVDIDRLLVVTFTNAAAAEMRKGLEKPSHRL